MTVRAVISIVRLHNLSGIALIATASVFWMGLENWGRVRLLAFVAGCVLVAAGGYAFNDLRDVHFDRIAHPRRPLVTGEISPLATRWISATTTILGVLVLVWIDPIFFLFAPLTALSLVVYSVGLKDRFGFVGNVLTSMLVAAIPFLAGLSAHDAPSIMPLVLVGFGLTLSREILKDIEDQPADACGGRRTLATTGHILVAKALVILSVLSAALAAWFMIARPEGGSDAVDLCLIVLATPPIAMVLYWFVRPQLVHPTQQVIKAAMFGYSALFLVLAVR
jgi:4-hydroxybenzoate polyprenyltransferase